MPRRTIKTGKERPKRPHGHECGICAKPRYYRKNTLAKEKWLSHQHDIAFEGARGHTDPIENCRPCQGKI